MTTIVIVEDEVEKATNLKETLELSFGSERIEICQSYNSGLCRLLEGAPPEIVILDMSMKTFDLSRREKGGRSRTYGGRDILDELARHEIKTSVIVVTQWDKFEDGSGLVSLAQLAAELTMKFPGLFVALIHYHEGHSNWRRELSDEVERVLEAGGAS